MAEAILVIGESGSGKSRSLLNMNPKDTILINVANKALPFKGSAKLFNIVNKNYKFTMDHSEIGVSLLNVSTNRPEIKKVVIDDFQYVIVDEFMTRAKETGYTKFNELAKHIYDLVNPRFIASLRPDLRIYYLAHNDVKEDGTSNVKTVGKVLDNHVNLAGLFTVMLHTEMKYSSNKASYFFRTNSDGNKVCKSPEDMFPDLLIPNDLDYVDRCITAFHNGDEQPALPQ
jgi:hypothetical protein